VSSLSYYLGQITIDPDQNRCLIIKIICLQQQKQQKNDYKIKPNESLYIPDKLKYYMLVNFYI
jgi:hypothetical protein